MATEPPKVNCQNCRDGKCDKCLHPDRCRCAYYKHSGDLRIGVKVDSKKPIDVEQFKEPLRPDDSEFKFQLKTNWQIIKSDVEFETKKNSRTRINELQVQLGQEKTVWLPDKMQKEVDECWKFLKSVKGSGVTKKQKDKAKKRINELEKLGGLDLTDFNEELVEAKNIAEELYVFAERLIKKVVVSKEDGTIVNGLIENNNHFETIQIPSSGATHWLSKLFYDEYKTIASDDSYKQALNQIKSQALYNDTPKEMVYNRIAFVDGVIYYDLASPKWEIVKITKDKISIINLDESTPFFKRTQHQAQQVYPILDSDRDALTEFESLLHIPDNLKLLFKTHVIANFLEGITTPIMLLVAEAGALKTTISSSVKRTVDPSGFNKDSNTSNFPKDMDSLNINVYNKFLSAFDNLSYISQEIADELCRITTGTQYSKRKLYFDIDEILLTFKRKLILAGVALSIEQTDLIQRTISYPLKEISDSERITDESFDNQFTEMLPYLLGQIFKILQKSLELQPEIHDEITQPERMADFTIWGETFARVMKYPKNDFVKDYSKNMKNVYDEMMDSHAIIPFMEKILNDEVNVVYGEPVRKDGKKKEIRVVSIGNFYSGLKEYAREHGFDVYSKTSNLPKSPNKLRGYLRKIKAITKTSLLDVVIKADYSNDQEHRNRTMIFITKLVPNPPA